MFDERRMAVRSKASDIMSISEESMLACSTNGEWRSGAKLLT